MVKGITILFLIMQLFQEGVACSCGEYLLDLPIQEMGLLQSKPNKKSGSSDLIFVGKLIDAYEIKEERLLFLRKKTVEYKYELVFKLVKSYKGNSHDTITIRTNQGSSACGFVAKMNTDCLIFAESEGRGFYYTYHSGCCKSISKEKDEKRFNKYIEFLESILNMKDGEYNFKQARSYWSKEPDTFDLISYTIKGGKFEGEWKVTNRKGRVIEIGQYKKGKKIGLWKMSSVYGSDYEGISTKTELTEYENNKPLKSTIIIEDRKMNFEIEKIEIVRQQTINKIFEYK